MARTLYQKIQHTEIISTEHAAIGNIIDQYAEMNDGYAVLYTMLELVHLALYRRMQLYYHQNLPDAMKIFIYDKV